MPLETLLFDSAVKATVLLVAACVAAALLRRASAAARHLLWSFTMAGLLLLPVLAGLLPTWNIVPDLFGVRTHLARDFDQRQASSASDFRRVPLPPQQDDTANSADTIATPRVARPMQPVATNPSVPVLNHNGAQPANASRTGTDASLWIFRIWFAGAVLALGRLGFAMVQMQRLRNRATHVADPAWTSLLVRLAAQIGRRHPVQLFECGRPCVPMTFGLLRPSILLPASAAQWSTERRRVVLLHELAHVQRRDCLTHLLGQVVAALYWFHPLVWLAARRLGIERERACDDLVLACGTEPCAYAEHVVELAAGLPGGSLAAAALAMARRSALEGRLRAILDPEVNRHMPGRLSTTLAAIALCAVVFPLAPLGHIRPSAAGAQPRDPGAAQGEDRSPFDRLDRSQIPLYELAAAGDGDADQAPAELVAILGDSRLNHWGSVFSLAFSSDGSMLVSASTDHTVKLWDPTTGRALRTLKGHTDSVQAVAVSSDGQKIATASVDKTVRIWDAPTGKSVHTLPHTSHLTSLAISPDDQYVAVPDNGELKLWDCESGKLVRSWATNNHTLVAFHPRDTVLATATYGEVSLWNFQTGGALHVLDVPRDIRAGDLSLAFSPDGRLIVFGTRRGIAFWNVATGLLERAIDATGALLCFSPDGRRIATGGNRSGVRVWDVGTGAELVTLNVGGTAYCAAFSPDGRSLATGAFRAIRLWDVATGREKKDVREPPRGTLAVAISGDGKTIAAATNGDAPVINLWDVRTRHIRRQLFGHSNEVHEIALSPDGALLASVSYMKDGTFKVWDLETGKTLWTRFPENECPGGFTFDPSGKTLICTIDGTLRMLDAATGEPIPLHIQDDKLGRWGIWPSADSTRFATVAGLVREDPAKSVPRVEVWDLANQELIRSFQVPRAQPGRTTLVDTVVLNSNGSTAYAAVSEVEYFSPGAMRRWSGRLVKQWQVATGEERSLQLEGKRGFDALRICSDGRTLVASAWDGTISVIDAPSLTLRQTNRVGPMDGVIWDIAFAPDGHHLVTANGNGTLYVLRLKR